MNDAVCEAIVILDDLISGCRADRERNQKLSQAILGLCGGDDSCRIGEVDEATPFDAAEQFAAKTLCLILRAYSLPQAAAFWLWWIGERDERPTIDPPRLARNIDKIKPALAGLAAAIPDIGRVDAAIRKVCARAKKQKSAIERFGNQAGGALDKAAQLIVVHAAAPTATSPVEAAEVLRGWADICAAVKVRHGDKRRLQRLNLLNNGPISQPSKGQHPVVAKAALVTWWNALAESHHHKQEEARRRNADQSNTVKATYQYGRTAIVATEITGSIRRRKLST